MFTILLFTGVLGAGLFALIVSLSACAIVFQVVYVTLLLFQGVGDVVLEEVVLNLELLNGV